MTHACKECYRGPCMVTSKYVPELCILSGVEVSPQWRSGQETETPETDTITDEQLFEEIEELAANPPDKRSPERDVCEWKWEYDKSNGKWRTSCGRTYRHRIEGHPCDCGLPITTPEEDD